MRRKRSVAFVLAPNFTMLALSAFVDTLRLAHAHHRLLHGLVR